MISTVLLGAAIPVAALIFLLVTIWHWQRVRQQHITDTTSTTHHND